MRPKTPGAGDGFVQELLPLMKNGFIVLRSILDILIERFEEAEKNRQADIRKETYLSIIDALEAEVENVRSEQPGPATEAKVEAIEAIVSVLLREIEELESTEGKRRRPKKVNIE